MPRLLIWRHSLPALSFNLHTVGFAARLRPSCMRSAAASRPGPPWGWVPGQVASLAGSASVRRMAKAGKRC